MKIKIINYNTLMFEEFKFKCCIGKNGFSKRKIEGDKKTPTGTFDLGPVYYRIDKFRKLITKLKIIKIKKYMGWCDDVNFKSKYNKPININKKIRHEKLYRNDYKYDLFIPIKYNYKKPILNKGSCIFIHLTKNYKPTAGCIALNKKDFLILIKVINKKTKIQIL